MITTWDARVLDQTVTSSAIGASLPTTVFVHEERRVTPLGVDFGITSRISSASGCRSSRVNTREGYPLDSAGALADYRRCPPRSMTLLADTTYAFDPLISSTRKHLMLLGPATPRCEAKYRFVESRSVRVERARS